ncbi:glycosyltransferase [Polynucleobacter paneuropaeus]|nr:glycosyltransferase [Polynucleobacter paneuropaeus]QWD09514.1 glycosyltransferase [Polynucleobacter paneuropaeus]
MQSIYSLSVLLPVMDETFSLVHTVEKIISFNDARIKKIIIISSPRTSVNSLICIKNLEISYGSKIIHIIQKKPYLGGALQDGFDIVRTTHLLLMASDLETDPILIPNMIETSLSNINSIVTVSRWLKKGHFINYSRIKWILNWIFQKFFSSLYSVNLTDMTYGYRIYPSHVLRDIKWKELRHPFLFECLLKPLLNNVKIIEISGKWSSRVEGNSHNPFHVNFSYIRVGLELRFQYFLK